MALVSRIGGGGSGSRQRALPTEMDGCTTRDSILVGNAGDSRCVPSRNNQVIDLSTDFKPNLPAQRQRIEAAEHVVTFDDRGNVHHIDDGIAISRSLDNLIYKANNSSLQQAITAFPEVYIEEITQDARLLILAYDGIWDFLTSHKAVDFIRIYLNADIELAFICEALLGHCLAQPRGRDNMTAVLVRLKTPGACQVRTSNVLPSLINQAAAAQAVVNQAAAAQAVVNQAATAQAVVNQAAAAQAVVNQAAAAQAVVNQTAAAQAVVNQAAAPAILAATRAPRRTQDQKPP